MIWGSPTRAFSESQGSQLPRRLQRDEVGSSSTNVWSRPEAFQHLDMVCSVSLVLLPFLGTLWIFFPPASSLLQSSLGKFSFVPVCSFGCPPPPAPICSLPVWPSVQRQELRVHMLSLGRAVTSPAASCSHTWQGREEELEWGRGLQAFHSSNRINLIYRHSKMQLKRELK